MRRCPRCRTQLNKKEKFCHKCGYNIKQHKLVSIKLLLVFILPFLTVTLPVLMTNDFMIPEDTNINTEEQIELPEVLGYAPTYVVKTYTSLEEFNKQFSNVDSIISGIHDYEQLLSKDKYDVKTSYKLELLDNMNIQYTLNYDIKINDHITLNVYKTFDRLGLYNDEKYTFKTNNTNEFEQLLLTEEDINNISEFIKGKEVIERISNDFNNRKDEFNNKKDNLGHYGIGNYEGDYSFVVYKDNDSYYSTLKYRNEVKELIQ